MPNGTFRGGQGGYEGTVVDQRSSQLLETYCQLKLAVQYVYIPGSMTCLWCIYRFVMALQPYLLCILLHHGSQARCPHCLL